MTKHSTYLLLLLCIVIIVPLVVHGNDWSCGPKFNGKCTCAIQNYENKPKYVVNCTNTGFQNTNVLEFMPNTTEVLIFTGNNIPELPWNVFGSINDYTKLTIIDMSNNHIREIRGKTYHHVQNVERLILNHNNLSISRKGDEYNHHHPRVFSNFVNLMELHLTNAFAENTSAALSEDLHDIFMYSNLTKIIKLHLEQNEIRKFKDRNVFCDLPSLMDLHLANNYLRELNFNVLCLKNLRFLDLEGNLFEMVKQQDLALMTNLERYSDRKVNLIVDFMYNPFQCDCGLEPFVSWIRTTNVTVRNKELYMCLNKNATKVALLREPIEVCKIHSAAAGGNNSTGHTILLATLMFLLVALLVTTLGAIVYMNKDRIKYVVSPIMDTVSKKVHYTTIKDDDCQEIHV